MKTNNRMSVNGSSIDKGAISLEEWKDLEFLGFPAYEVSSLGRIRSLNHMNTGKIQLKTPSKRYDGYLQVQLADNGYKKQFLLHRLVALAFIPTIEGKTEVNHKDFNRENCQVENLEWCSRSENEQHKIPRVSGANGSNAKLTWDEVNQIRAEYKWHSEKNNMYALARKFGRSVNCIRNILQNKTWKDPSYIPGNFKVGELDIRDR